MHDYYLFLISFHKVLLLVGKKDENSSTNSPRIKRRVYTHLSLFESSFFTVLRDLCIKLGYPILFRYLISTFKEKRIDVSKKYNKNIDQFMNLWISKLFILYEMKNETNKFKEIYKNIILLLWFVFFHFFSALLFIYFQHVFSQTFLNSKEVLGIFWLFDGIFYSWIV